MVGDDYTIDASDWDDVDIDGADTDTDASDDDIDEGNGDVSDPVNDEDDGWKATTRSTGLDSTAWDEHLIGSRVESMESYGVRVAAVMYEADAEVVDVTARHDRAGEMRVHRVERTSADPAEWRTEADDAPDVITAVAQRIQRLDRAVREQDDDVSAPPVSREHSGEAIDEDALRDDEDEGNSIHDERVDDIVARIRSINEDIDWSGVEVEMGDAFAVPSIVGALESASPWMSVAGRSNDRHSDLWHYTADDGWIPDAGEYIVTPLLTSDATPAHVERSTVRKVIYQLSARNRVPEESLNRGPVDDGAAYVPVENGVLRIGDNVDYDADTMTIDADTVDLVNHSPSHRWTYRLPTEWDPETADIDGVEEWMQELTTTDEARRLMWEFAGHSLTTEWEDHGFLILLGQGGGGKSKWFRAIRETLGSDNVSSQSLRAIENERFGMASVEGNLLNIDDDVSGDEIEELGTLKKFATGADMIIDRKSKPAIDKKNETTLIMASQNVPRLPERGRAVGRRLYPVEIAAQYVDDPDPSDPNQYQADSEQAVIERVTSDEYRRAVLLKAVEGLVRIRREGRFSSEREWEDRLRMYESWSDPLAAFVRTCIDQVDGAARIDEEDDVAVSASDLDRAYDVFAQLEGYEGKSIQQIAGFLGREPWISASKNRDRAWSESDGKETYYTGIRWTDWAKQHVLGDWADWHRYLTPGDSDDDDEDDAGWSDVDERRDQVMQRVRASMHADDADGVRIPQVARECASADGMDEDVVVDDIETLMQGGRLRPAGGVGSERVEVTE